MESNCDHTVKIITLQQVIDAIFSYHSGPDDYTAVSELLAFEECQQLNCVELNIINDLTVETTESFGVILERTEDMSSAIILNPSDAVLEIRDDDCEYIEQIFYVESCDVTICIYTPCALCIIFTQWLKLVWRQHYTRCQRMGVW